MTDIKYNYQTKLENTEFYFRIIVKEGGECSFSYSTDGRKYKEIGEPFQARQGKWIGAKVGMFIMNQVSDTARSWMDVDWFRIEK